jgi:hypothetical protein
VQVILQVHLHLKEPLVEALVDLEAAEVVEAELVEQQAQRVMEMQEDQEDLVPQIV